MIAKSWPKHFYWRIDNGKAVIDDDQRHVDSLFYRYFPSEEGDHENDKHKGYNCQSE